LGVVQRGLEIGCDHGGVYVGLEWVEVDTEVSSTGIGSGVESSGVTANFTMSVSDIDGWDGKHLRDRAEKGLTLCY